MNVTPVCLMASSALAFELTGWAPQAISPSDTKRRGVRFHLRAKAALTYAISKDKGFVPVALVEC